MDVMCGKLQRVIKHRRIVVVKFLIGLNQKKYSSHDGYVSGFGDLWSWSFICTLDKELSQELSNVESSRVFEIYIKGNKVIE